MHFFPKAYFYLISFFCFAFFPALSQNQKIADSLARVYHSNTITNDTARMELLRNLAFNEGRDIKQGLAYAEELIALSKQAGNYLYLYRGYFQKGNKIRLLGNLDDAMNAYLKSVEAAQKANFTRGEASAYAAVADIYSISKNHQNAMLYYGKAIASLRKSNDSLGLASAISNAGDEYLRNKNYDAALSYFNEAKMIFEKINYPSGKGYSIGNIGMVYASIGQKEKAEKNINEAINILQETGDFYPICVYLISMSDIYREKGDEAAAMAFAERSFQLAEQFGLKEQISTANLKLSELYERKGNYVEALKYYKNYIVYKESVNNIKTVQQLADLRTDFEVSQKQVEVDLLNKEKRNQRNIMVSLFVIFLLTAILLCTLYLYFRTISKEKKKSESLLLNILPAETAKELKLKGKVDAVRFNEVTVLFTDFVQFTKQAEYTEPEQLVKSIDFYFKAFDEITTLLGMEKIKTIGDAYMCACGLPSPNLHHAKNAILAAKEMMELVNSEMNKIDNINHFEVRIGIHTGPVVAGIVGTKKWQYDIWGDTVNIAAGMESMSLPGRINLSETTHAIIKNDFDCEYRGELEVKNRGKLKMYFLL